MRLTTSLLITLCLSVLVSPAIAQHEHHAPAPAATSDLGDLQFANSGSPEAQESFIRGMLLLHSFEYRSSAAAFRDAQKIDPSFAMAYWGEAMTYNHPIWREQDTEAARAVMARLAPTAAERASKAPTAREKDYLAALETLYGEGSKQDRDAAYSAALEQITQKYPDDLDGRAFYALSLLGLTGDVRDTRNYMRAAAIAEEVYEVNRRHPGALHYMIHAYDDPIHAPLGLRAARLYSKIAPAASHAQHMPSHIFFALGMWDEGIASNRDSLHTAHQQGSSGYHPLHWLQYAHLQKGHREDAKKLMSMIESDVAEGGSGYGRVHLAMMRATWLVETGFAALPESREPVDRGTLKMIGPFAGHELARGLAALNDGDPKGASSALSSLRQLIAEAKKSAASGDTTGSRLDTVSAEELTLAEIMELQLQAAVQLAAGKRDEALRLIDRAATLEDVAVFEYGPPATVKPPYEQYGEMLLAAGRHDEAAAKFEHALSRYPNRRLSVEGLNRANASGQTASQ